MTGPLALIILDGWGIRAERDQNAVALAEPATFLDLLKRYPSGTLEASGEAVGLPAGQMGNSEVGHTNLAPAVVYQTSRDRQNPRARPGDAPGALAAYDRCRLVAHALHRTACSDGGVHTTSSTCALIALARRAAYRACSCTSSPTDATRRRPADAPTWPPSKPRSPRWASAASLVSGRYWAMDRASAGSGPARLRHGRPRRGAIGDIGGRVIEVAYAKRSPTSSSSRTPSRRTDGKPVGPIRDGDSVVLFNFRADRMRQIVRALAFEDFDGLIARAAAWPRVATTLTR
jgi:2,3-bisphosphoglycerate-independent phosphoglycerate mutase